MCCGTIKHSDTLPPRSFNLVLLTQCSNMLHYAQRQFYPNFLIIVVVKCIHGYSHNVVACRIYTKCNCKCLYCLDADSYKSTSSNV